MYLNAERSAALLMVAVPVTTLGASGASSGRVVVIAPDLTGYFVEELSDAPHARFLMASDSDYSGLCCDCACRCKNIHCLSGNVLQ